MTADTPQSGPDPRDRWRNGWTIGGSYMLMGSAVRCVGCGQFQGITTVDIPEDWQPPSREPDWPFPENDCPVAHGLVSPYEDGLRAALQEIADWKPQHWCSRRARTALEAVHV